METSSLDFKPHGRRVMVLRHKPNVGGLKLTEELERESHPDIGEIVKVGQIGFWNKYIRGIKKGRKITFVRYSPIKIAAGEQEWIVVDIDNILCVQE